MTAKKVAPNCGLLELHHLLGKKWTYGLLFNLNDNPLSFTQIQNMADSSINPTLLSNRLKELVTFGVVERIQDETRVYYKITKQGIELKVILHSFKLLADKLNCTIPKCCMDKDCSGCPSFRF